MVEQYGVYWVELDPTRGGEMAKTRPCVVVTPSDLNMYLTIVVIAPITSTIRNYPYRVLCSVAGRDGEIATDQIRTVDKSRLKRKKKTKYPEKKSFITSEEDKKAEDRRSRTKKS